MDIKNGFVGTIGNTPLIRLDSFSEETGCEILGKAEFLNPGGSVKDRAALYIIKDAEEKGLLKPGGTVVEGTAEEEIARQPMGDATGDTGQQLREAAEHAVTSRNGAQRKHKESPDRWRGGCAH